MQDILTANATDAARPQQEAPWLRFYDTGVPHSPDYRDVSLFAWLDEAADTHPDSVACSYHNTSISYAAMRKKAEIIAANLRERGVGDGDRVVIMLPNLPQTMLSFR